ncbi:MAG: response regulator [Thermodesulfovibrionales bacterium]|nr:response regulator [Thermodesulfovibrionales bacterium]
MDKPSILVIDDDNVVREVLYQIITGMGMTCELAENGKEGIERLKLHPCDLILTDITMPVMDGLQFLREIKDITPFTPVAIITGYPTFENAVEAMREGARDFIVKPFNVEKIRTTIDRLLKEKRLIGNPLSGKEDLKKELIKRLQEIAILQSICSELDELYDNRLIYERIVEMVSRLLMARDVAFGIIKNGVLKIEASTVLIKKEIPLSEPLQRVMKNGSTLLLKEGERNPLNELPLCSQLLLIPLIINGEVFGILSISNKIDEKSFSEDEIYLAQTFGKKVSLRIENNALYELFYNNLLNTLKSLIASIEARDSYTKQHSERVTNYALEIAEVMGLGAEDKECIKFGGYLHDIGKIGVRDTVLLKPSTLTEEEMAEIRLHPVIGESIVRPLKFLPAERELILHHHERFDGRGYPHGLAGERIPILARILAVADTYDAMTSARPYRPALGHEFAIEELRNNAGSQFDPMVVKAFLQTKTGRKVH